MVSFQEILEESLDKKRFKVSSYKYGFSGETVACSKAQAVAYIAVRYAKEKGSKANYASIVSDFKKSATVKLLESLIVEKKKKRKKKRKAKKAKFYGWGWGYGGHGCCSDSDGNSGGDGGGGGDGG